MGMSILENLAPIGERAAKTFAQAMIAYLAVGEISSLYDIDWGAAFGVAGLATLLSVLTSILSWNAGVPGPSLGGSEVPLKEVEAVVMDDVADEELDEFDEEEVESVAEEGFDAYLEAKIREVLAEEK